MTSSLEDQAERELARMQQARTERAKVARRKPDTAPPKTPQANSDAPKPRFVQVSSGDPLGRRAGVYWVSVSTDKQTGLPVERDPQWICSPLRIDAVSRDAANGEWGRLLVFPDRDGLVHRWAMPMSLLARGGDELRERLLEQGLELTSDPLQRRRLADYISEAAPAQAARCVSRTGWHGDAFVLPSETFGDAGEPLVFQTAAVDAAKLSTGGTLEGWRERVCVPCAGNSRMVLALSAAFAAPCLALAGLEGGGIHFRGASSVGKSTTLTVACSAYGPPSYRREWKTSDNGLEPVAALHSDMLLCLDEIQQLDARHAAGAAYLLSNGQGKARARRDGGAKAPATWRVLFLSAGELGLADLMNEAGGRQRAGVEVRVIDLHADAGAGFGLFERVPEGSTPGAFADRLKAVAAADYGHAFPAFLRAVCGDLERARGFLRTAMDALAGELSDGAGSGQVRRVAQRFALIAAAGELATAYGLTGWPQGEAEQSARVCFASWLKARGTKGNTEPAAMLAQVRAFLEANGEARFSPWEPREHGPRTINRAGFRRDSEMDGPEWMIETEAWRREVCAGFDPRAVAKLLVELGVIRPDSDGAATRKERLPDGRHARVYRVTAKLWEVEL